MSRLAFVDTETTGLDPDRHEIWEVGLIVREADGQEHDHRWFLPVDLGVADPFALKIGGYHERHPKGYDRPWPCDDTMTWPMAFSEEFAKLTRGAHLVGAVVSFDEERLRKLLKDNEACPEWHYHLIDVENLAAAHIAGEWNAINQLGLGDPWADGPTHGNLAIALSLPWDSEALSIAVGVDPEDFDRHTALGDARWAKAIYEMVLG